MKIGDYRAAPAVQKALTFLAKLAGEKADDPSPVLPPIAELAAMAGVSLVTMWKAVSVLKKKGSLTGSRGHPTMIPREAPHIPACSGPVAPGSKPALPCGQAWQLVRSRIEWDLLEGAFSRGKSLPAQKELISRYGTSFRSLRRALQSLAADRVLAVQGRGYAARGSGPVLGRSRVVVLVLASPDRELLLGDLDRFMIYSLEAECTRVEINFDILAFIAHAGPDLVFYNDRKGTESSELVDSPEVLGYVLLAIHPDSAHEQLLRRLASFRKPCAVLDQVGGLRVPLSLRNAPMVKVFTMAASTMPGRKVGRFLLDRGHRTVAYISPFHHQLWSRERYQGLMEVFGRAGNERAVRTFTINEYRAQYDLEQSARLRYETRPLREFYTEWRASMPGMFARAVDRRIDQIGGIVLLGAEIGPESYELFEKAIACPEITAWVLANDFIAEMALDFLFGKKVRVPQILSLVGFDNTFHALHRGITSFDFNSAAVASAMLSYLVRPRSLAVFRKQQTVEIEGMVVERQTTGVVR